MADTFWRDDGRCEGISRQLCMSQPDPVYISTNTHQSARAPHYSHSNRRSVRDSDITGQTIHQSPHIGGATLESTLLSTPIAATSTNLSSSACTSQGYAPPLNTLPSPSDIHPTNYETNASPRPGASHVKRKLVRRRRVVAWTGVPGYY